MVVKNFERFNIIDADFDSIMSQHEESKHFLSLQIFTSHAEPALDEFLDRKEQTDLENKHREEEDKLYR